MVVFTCSHCGDSIQKPKVEKHYQTVCRSIKSVTCVDCLKDFRGEEYAEHTKCVTEDERYAAKGSTAKMVVKKGEAKQESWTELVKSVVDKAVNVPSAQKRVLEVISTSVNVPRKKNKFINFLKSSTGGRIKHEDVEAVWNLLEQEKSVRNQVSDEAANINDVTSKKQEPTALDNGVLETSPTGDAHPEGKKKKHKKNKACDSMPTNHSATDKMAETVPNTNGTSKKKRKSGNDIVFSVVNQKSDVMPETNADEDSPKKKRKSKGVEATNREAALQNETVKTKSKKRKSGSNDHSLVETAPVIDSFKKKHISSSISDEALNTNKSGPLAETAPITSSSSKKKLKLANTVYKEQALDTNCIKNDETLKRQDNVHVQVDISTVGVPELEFSYQQQILKVLTKHATTLEKLQKKVLAAYSKKTGNAASNKTVKKFNKKLKKMTEVEIKDNNVKLVNNA